MITPRLSKMLEFPFKMSVEMHMSAHMRAQKNMHPQTQTVCSANVLLTEGCSSHFVICIMMLYTSGFPNLGTPGKGRKQNLRSRRMIKGIEKQKKNLFLQHKAIFILASFFFTSSGL